MNDMTPPSFAGAIPTTLNDWATDQEVRWHSARGVGY